MNLGKMLFAQIMEFVPWASFARIVERYGGNVRVPNLSCPEQIRAMASAQLTYLESLRGNMKATVLAIDLATRISEKIYLDDQSILY